MDSSRSSATGRLIARCTLLAARDPLRGTLVPPGAEALLVAMLAADGGSAWFEFALRHTWARTMLGLVERATLPGITTHYLARKAWIEAAVRSALVRGVTQVVVLGAGFDTLAWRLHSGLPSAEFIELDHPATQAPKRRALGGASNFTLLAGDLYVQSPAVLLRACPSFSPDRLTLFIAEGLLMYFPEPQVATLLRELATLTRAPADVLFTFMAQAADGSISFRGESAAIGWWLRRSHEPFQWGIPRERLAAFLQPLGLLVTAVAGHADLRTRILAPRGLTHLALARGECLCDCSTIAP